MSGRPEHLFYDRELVRYLLFPGQTGWQGKKILVIGGRENRTAHIRGPFPGAGVVETDMVDVWSWKGTGPGPFDYIAGARLGSEVSEPAALLKKLLGMLTPQGVVSASVWGYTGYFAALMVKRLVALLAGEEERESQIESLRRLLKALPAAHPLRLPRDLWERLTGEDRPALEEVLTLAAEKIFTVEELLTFIAGCGGRLLDWLIPGWYDPSYLTGSAELHDKFNMLPGPTRWMVSEMAGSFPPVHHFFLVRAEKTADRTSPDPWQSPDILDWKVIRLPLYRWRDLVPADDGGGVLPPLEAYPFLNPLTLGKRETEWCRSADGSASLGKLVGTTRPVGETLKRLVDWRAVALLPPDPR